MKFYWFKTIKILGIEFEDWTNIIIIIFANTRTESDRQWKMFILIFFYHSTFFLLQFDQFILNLFKIRLDGLFWLSIYKSLTISTCS
jgi:hypothetical protein